MLIKTHSFQSEIVDFVSFAQAAEKLLKKYKPEQLQIRLGMNMDSWGQTWHPIQICVYTKEIK